MSCFLLPEAISRLEALVPTITSVAVENGVVMNGHPVYGAAIRVTNNLTGATTGAYAVMIHRRAIASAMQINTPWMKPFEELHEIRFQHEALWGVLEVRDDFGIPFYTRKA